MYRLKALNKRPVAFWLLDDTTPFQEYTGSALTGTGTSTSTAPLVPQAANARVFKDSARGTFQSSVFKQGAESQGFTLEAWVYPVVKTSTGTQSVLSHLSLYDGISLTADGISFTTKYTTAPDAVLEYEWQGVARYHVVAVHTEFKNQLYVNGSLVAEIELDDDQRADTYEHSTTDLIAGQSATDQEVAMNGVALYARSLSEVEIAENYAAGNEFGAVDSVMGLYGGEALLQESANVFLEEIWNTAGDWAAGYGTNVEIQENLLQPALDLDNISLAGEWLGSFALDFSESTSINGVVLDWVGQGAVVEASIDGASWVTATRGVKLSNVPAGFDPTDTELEIRVSFAGGVLDDPAYLESLTISALEDSTISADTIRGVTYSGSATPRGVYPPHERNDLSGIRLSGGTITIDPSTDAPSGGTRTLELWVKRTSATALSISISGTEYRNGVASSTAPAVGEWVLMHIVTAANVTTPITISGNAIIGHIALYGEALTSTQIGKIWSGFIGGTATVVTESAGLTVGSTSDVADIYSHEWAVTGAG